MQPSWECLRLLQVAEGRGCAGQRLERPEPGGGGPLICSAAAGLSAPGLTAAPLASCGSSSWGGSNSSSSDVHPVNARGQCASCATGAPCACTAAVPSADWLCGTCQTLMPDTQPARMPARPPSAARSLVASHCALAAALAQDLGKPAEAAITAVLEKTFIDKVQGGVVSAATPAVHSRPPWQRAPRPLLRGGLCMACGASYQTPGSHCQVGGATFGPL